jgi:predicted ATP-binding protein involved in virulence
VASTSKSKIKPVSYFLSLEIKNVRCFGPEQCLSLASEDDPERPSLWTVILGNNNTGKTTLLQSLAIFSSSAGSLARAFEKEAERTLARDGAKTPELQVKVARGDEILTLHRGESIEIPCYAYGAGRTGREFLGLSTTGSRLDEPDMSLFQEDVFFRNAEAWLLRLKDELRDELQAKKREALQERLVLVEELIVKLLPEVEGIKYEELNSAQRVKVKTPYGWVLLRSLSMGFRAMIAWVVDLASRMFERYPESQNPLEEPAVVLVDEIDLHLHPKWQRDLMGYLQQRFPRAQFIVTAHGPLIAQSAAKTNLVVLKRPEGKDYVEIENNPKGVHGWRVDQILTSELFGLESARPKDIEDKIKRRADLLSKQKKTAKEREELQRLEADLDALPSGETPAEMRLRDFIRRETQRFENTKESP